MSNRRPARKIDALSGRPLFWPTEPRRVPVERQHATGRPVGDYTAQVGAYGCVTVTEPASRAWDYAAFDVELP